MGKICCDLSSSKIRVNITEYEIAEDVIFQESFRLAILQVCFNEDTNEAKFNCQLFESRGILCKHQIVVFLHMQTDKYLLKWWRKTVKRSYTKVQINYDNWASEPKALYIDKMCNAYEVAELGAHSKDCVKKGDETYT